MINEKTGSEVLKNLSEDCRYGLLVSLCAFLVYANSLVNGFTLDDHVVIVNNPALKGSALALFKMTDTAADSQLLPFYRPLTNMTFLFDGLIHGFNPFYIRLVNVLFHSANAFLVYRLARTLFKNNIFAALLVGLLFAIHPLHTEGVNFNAGGRITMMACFFAILAYLLHNRSVLSSKIFWAYAGAVMFLAGLFSKEIALMILPIIITLEIQTMRGNAAPTRLRALFRLVPYCIALTIYLIMRWQTLSKLGIQTSILPGLGTKLIESMYITTDFNTRLLNNVYIVPRYLLTVIWPAALANRYVVPEDLNLLALPLFASWACILGGLGWLLMKGRSAVSLFGIAWVILFWLPVSGIVFVPGAPLADRFFYIPAIGIWILLVDQFCRVFQINETPVRRSILTIIVLALIPLAALTFRRNLDWKDNLTLHTRFVAQYPDNIHARAGLGKVFYGIGNISDLQAAEDQFDKVIETDSNFPMIHTYLGNINLNQEDLEDALYHYSKAIEVYPYDKEARLNRGITLEKLGRPKEALTDYLFFLTSPGNSDNLPGGREHAEKRLKELSR